MKILVLSDDFPPKNLGGGGAVAFDLAKALAKRGHEILVVTTVRNHGEAGEVTFGGLRIICIASSYPPKLQSYISLYNITVVRQVKAIIDDFRPDVVHAHNIHGHISYGSLKAAKQAGAKVFLTCHDVMTFSHGKLTEFIDKNDLSVPNHFNYRLKPFQQLFSYRLRYNPFRNAVIRHVLKKYVDGVFAVSNALKQAMNDNGIHGAKVVYNSIDVDEWKASPAAVDEFKKKYELGDSAVLFGGRLSGIKGGTELIQALGTVIKTVPDVQLLVVGEKNAYAHRMLELAAKSGLAEKIIFTGWLSGNDLHLAYHAAALAASPSVCFDSFVMVNLEAMACRKPAITTCFGGAREVVQDGVTGFVINPYDVSALAEKIAELLANKEKARQFGEAGYARSLEVFSLADCAGEYEKAFNE